MAHANANVIVPAAGTGQPQAAILTGLQGLPLEMLEEVTSYLDPVDIGGLRLTDKQMHYKLMINFYVKLVKDRTIYATFASMGHFLGMLNVFAQRSLQTEFKEICLVADGVRVPQLGYEWAWENLIGSEAFKDLVCTEKDLDIIADANSRHFNFALINEPFINGGGYRAMLLAILSACPNLNVLNVRKLEPTEQVKGWLEPEKFKKLSFYREGLNIKDVFYGDWQYDTVKYRVTHSKDEFGDDVVEPGAGPQASFIDDLNAAVAACGRPITVNFIRG